MGGSVLLLRHMPSRGAQGQIYWPNIRGKHYFMSSTRNTKFETCMLFAVFRNYRTWPLI
jgi:hypothetical protein